MGQLSDPYEQGEQDDVEITLSGLPTDDEPDPADAEGSEDSDEGEAVDEFVDDDEASFQDSSIGAGREHGAGAEGGGEEQPETEEIAYDLTEWEDDRLDLLFDRLDEEMVQYLWDGEELFIRETDELLVDNLIDQVSRADILATEDDDGDGGAELLGELFVVADILGHDPGDHEASVALINLARTAEDAEAPYGLAEAEWDQLRTKVVALEDLLLVEDDVDEEAVLEAAADLRSAIRPYV